MTAQDLQLLLRQKLTRRLHLNPRYSLRAFAKHLGVSPAYVSLVMNGKRSPAHAALKKNGPQARRPLDDPSAL